MKAARIESLKYRIGKLDLKPGDILVLSTNLLLDPDQAKAVRDRARTFARGHKIMVLTGGLKLGVIRNHKNRR